MGRLALRSRRARWLLGSAALLTLAGVALAIWSHAQALPPFELDTWVPQDVTEVLWTADLDQVARGIDGLTSRVPGAEGVHEVVQLLAGVDLLDADAVQEAGFREDAGIVAYRWQGAAWLVLPVLGPRGAQHVVDLLRRRGYPPVLQTATTDRVLAHWSLGDRTDAAREALHIWHLPDAVVVRWTPRSAAAQPPALAWTQWVAAKRLAKGGLHAGPGEVHVRLDLPPDGPLTAAMHEALGPGNLLLGGLVDRFIRADADLQLVADTPSLHVQLKTAPGAAADVAGFHAGFLAETPGTLLDLGDLLPDETVLLLRARVNPGLLQMVPAGLRDRVLPASLLGALHPALVGVDARSALLAAMDGETAVGLLSVADAVPLDPRAWQEQNWRKSLSAFAAAMFTSDVAAQAFMQSCRTALETSTDRPVTAQIGNWSGFSVPGPDAPWLLLRSNRSVALVSGQGASEDLQRIAAHRFPNLAAAAHGAIEADLVAGRRFWLGALATTPRTVRSLRRSGVPDHFLQMLASLSSASAAVQLTADGLDVTVQLRPSAEEDAAHPAEGP